MLGKDSKINAEDAETIIGTGVKVDGTFIAHGNVILKGDLVGSLETESDFQLGDGGSIQADIKAKNAFVAGGVNGNLNVDEKIELASSANVKGDINCNVLAIEEGAVLKGKCNVGRERPETDTKPYTEEEEEE